MIHTIGPGFAGLGGYSRCKVCDHCWYGQGGHCGNCERIAAGISLASLAEWITLTRAGETNLSLLDWAKARTDQEQAPRH